MVIHPDEHESFMMKRMFIPLLPALATIALAGCTATAERTAGDEPLVNTYWKLTDLEGAAVEAVDNQREAHIVLHTEENRVAGFGGCNRLMGSYRLDGDALSFGQLATTMMACADGMQTEHAFLEVLEKVSAWEVTGSNLTLKDGAGDDVARFEAVHLY